MYDNLKFERGLDAIVHHTGKIKVGMTSNAAIFSSKMSDYIDSYQILYREVIECAKDINQKSQELATNMFAMNKFLDQLSELNKTIKCHNQ